MDGLDWRWLTQAAGSGQAPNLRRFVDQAAKAAYNPLAAPRDVAGAYLTAAVGVRVSTSGPVEADSGPMARAIYRRRTGEEPGTGQGSQTAEVAPTGKAPHPGEPPVRGELGAHHRGDAAAAPGPRLHLNFPRLSADARRDGSFAPVGWLGQTLREAGVRTVVAGDPAWTAEGEHSRAARPPGSPLALAALLVMDRKGLVEQGIALAERDPASPGGLRTNWAEVPRVLRRAAQEGGCPGPPADRRRLMVLASGDLWRLLAEEEEMTPAARRRHQARLVRELDRLVGWWYTDPFWGRGSLLMVGPAPGPAARDEGRLLTAWAWAGPWGPGAAGSPTTRRAGLVTGLDLAPTLAAMAGVQTGPQVVGRAVTMERSPISPASLERFSRQRAVLWRDRLRVLSALTTAQVLALGGCLVGLWRAARPAAFATPPAVRPPGSRPFRLLRFVAVWAAAVPLGLLVPWAAWPLSVAAGPAWVAGAAGAVALVVAVGALAAGRRLEVSATSVVCAGTATLLAADLTFGWDLVARSFMGYDLTAGARFYGIGNEHLGIFLGSLLVAAAEAGERWPRLAPAASAALPAGLGLVAAPALGANVGGAVACSVAFTAALMGWHAGGKPGRRAAAGRALAGLAAAALTVAAMVAWDAPSSSASSHLGRALQAAREVGPQYLMEVAARKVSLNLRLLRYSLYSRILVVAMLAVMAAFWARAGSLGPRLRESPRLRAALQAAALGAAAALVANDSGVTAAAGALLGPAAQVLELGPGALPIPAGGGERGQEGPHDRPKVASSPP